MGTRGEEGEVIVVVEEGIIEEAEVDMGEEDTEEEEALVEVITMKMTVITTDKVIVTGAEVSTTP